MNNAHLPQHVEASAIAALNDTRRALAASRERQLHASAALRAGLLDGPQDTHGANWRSEVEARLQRRESLMQTASDAMQTTVLRDLASALDTVENLRRFQTQQARAHYDATYGQRAEPTAQRTQAQATPADVIDVQAKPVAAPPA